MGCIREGPTSAANKTGPASLSQGQWPDAIYKATSDLGSHPSYLDGWLRLARPKVPSAAIPRQVPQGEGCNVEQASPRRLGRVGAAGGKIYPVKRSGHHEIFPDVGSGLPRRPIT
jgi:hypothetical protein